MHDFRFTPQALDSPHPSDSETPRRLDGRTFAGKLLRDTRKAYVAQFGESDPLKLGEAVLLRVALTRLGPEIAKGNAEAINRGSRIANTLMRLRRELRAAAENRETTDA